MALENLILTEPVKEKLKNFRKYLPEEDDFTCQFASYLASRLNPKLFPEGFSLMYTLAVADLRRGGIYDSRNVKVPINLIGYPDVIYDQLEMKMPYIAEAVCPPEFAREVRKNYEDVRNLMREEIRKKEKKLS